MRCHRKSVHPEAALAVSAGITGITFAAVVAVMAVQHASDQATQVRNAGPLPAPPKPSTTTTAPPTTTVPPQAATPPVVVITKEVTVTQQVTPPPSTSARSVQPRELPPQNTGTKSPLARQMQQMSEFVQQWPSFAGDVFDTYTGR
ncbi:hypothetical protein GCM10010174_15820 [Kutzneria viridogrisea]|uniref:Uncharacterized protein n=2 Tax=Kutzneria TaxID=43356 RepID=W5WHW7_9PSEU|nr:hypothetical protein [Kutzneria albida]AHI00794.1 hypothetical protein KALB_7436 [Kutzneria albida DSM 43870]MBA8926070.1 hypothetical protein [Kutzneria viridogrisea]